MTTNQRQQNRFPSSEKILRTLEHKNLKQQTIKVLEIIPVNTIQVRAR